MPCICLFSKGPRQWIPSTTAWLLGLWFRSPRSEAERQGHVTAGDCGWPLEVLIAHPGWPSLMPRYHDLGMMDRQTWHTYPTYCSTYGVSREAGTISRQVCGCVSRCVGIVTGVQISTQSLVHTCVDRFPTPAREISYPFSGSHRQTDCPRP